MIDNAYIHAIQARIEKGLALWELPEQPANLYDPIRFAMRGGGKRLRPALVLMGCSVYGDNLDEALPAAMAVEVFHNFSLVHDDVMDRAPLRRGRPSVWHKYGTDSAILSGDTMLVHCYKLLAASPPELLPDLLDIFNRMAIEVCEGQQLDMDFGLRNGVTLEEYMHMIGLKTAVLLGASLQMGALVGGAGHAEAGQLYHFGRWCGLAFQLQDDMLDVFGDPAKVGKQVGGDIVANKKTFLLIKAIELATPDQRAELLHWTGGETFDPETKVRAVRAIYDEIGLQQHAQKAMNHCYEQAKMHLERASGRGITRQHILQFTDALMLREH